MDPEEIDWTNIVSHYEHDEIYESINAPKWLDFSAPDAAVDDVAWFCRPDCHHPITYEDFDRWSPSPKVKILTSNSNVALVGQQDNSQRDANLKRRGGIVPFSPSPSKPKSNFRKAKEDVENQNPNIEITPPLMKEKKKKEAIKSSAEKKGDGVKEEIRETQRKRSPNKPQLKSTFSARNLFSGKDIMSQISEFCHELKRLATGKETSNEIVDENKALISTIKTGSLRKCELIVKFDGSEEKKKRIIKESRAHPPTPQRFPSPSNHHPQFKCTKASANSNSSSPLCKIPKSKTPERRVLKELDQKREEEKTELIPKNEDDRTSVDSEEEGRSTPDLFWFLKPCYF